MNRILCLIGFAFSCSPYSGMQESIENGKSDSWDERKSCGLSSPIVQDLPKDIEVLNGEIRICGDALYSDIKNAEIQNDTLLLEIDSDNFSCREDIAHLYWNQDLLGEDPVTTYPQLFREMKGDEHCEKATNIYQFSLIPLKRELFRRLPSSTDTVLLYLSRAFPGVPYEFRRTELPPPAANESRQNASVYWVGHSLISHRPTEVSSTLMEIVGEFARTRGQDYDSFDHTIPGAPLSWNWNEVSDLRREIETRGNHYDVMVMTEGISLEVTLEAHHSAFYAQRFYCAMINANPDAEVFLYESWHHLYASDPDGYYPEPHRYDWRKRLDEDRPRWESILDDVHSDLNVPEGAYNGQEGRCTPSKKMRLIPVGTALAALSDRLDSPPAGEDWEGFTIHDFVANGYTNWPEEWPVDSNTNVDWRRRLRTLKLKDRNAAFDDIHPSAIGVYFIGLVHYATIYRRSPVGLPTQNGVSSNLARLMQELVWDVVRRDPRSGVMQD